MSEAERLVRAVAASRRVGMAIGFLAGAIASTIGTAFVIARWYARCRP